MFRLWCKIISDNRLIDDNVIVDERNDTRTHKIFNAIETFCYEKNLSVPIWLDSNISDFKHFNKVRFNKDNFIEEIEFDYLEITIIEED